MASSSKATVDNRLPNTNPLGLPAGIALAVNFDGQTEGVITLVQGEKLSAAGNVSFSGAINPSFGWALPGTDPTDSLRRLAFTATPVDENGNVVGPAVELERTAQDVHTSGERRSGKALTVTHMAIIDLPTADGETVEYAVSARPEFVIGKGAFQLRAQATPKMVGGGNGNTHRGELAGFSRLG